MKPDIKFNSNSEEFITKAFLSYLDSGYELLKAYSKRKYFIFGERRFYVEMNKSDMNYKIALDIAMSKEDYLEVDRLTKEYKEKKNLKF